MSALYAGRLALRAIMHRPLPALVSTLGLAAVLAPLLILYGLKSGIVFGLVENLRNDPSILRVSLVGNAPMTEEDIEALRRRPEVGFVVGSPRSLAARMELSSPASMSDSVMADWLPSGDGDPLLPQGAALDADEIAITEQLSEALGVGAGGEVVAIAYRNRETEILEFRFTVAQLVPRHLMAGTRVLAHADAMDKVAAFHDNYEIPEAGLSGKPITARVANYDSVRLYASSLDSVINLDRIMGELGFRAESKASNIQWVKTLDTVMAGVFAIIAAAGVIGSALSLWANVTSNLQQYRSQLSLLRLLGLKDRALVAFPFVQVLVIASAGLALSTGIAAFVAYIINGVYLTEMFADRICRISIGHVAAAAAVSYGVAIVVVLQQVRSLRRISMSEALAENV